MRFHVPTVTVMLACSVLACSGSQPTDVCEASRALVGAGSQDLSSFRADSVIQVGLSWRSAAPADVERQLEANGLRVDYRFKFQAALLVTGQVRDIVAYAKSDPSVVVSIGATMNELGCS